MTAQKLSRTIVKGRGMGGRGFPVQHSSALHSSAQKTRVRPSREVFFEYGENGCPKFPAFDQDVSFDYMITEAKNLLGVCFKQTNRFYTIGIPCKNNEIGLAFLKVALDRTQPALFLLKMYSEKGVLPYETITREFEKVREYRALNVGYQRHPTPALLARQVDFAFGCLDGVSGRSQCRGKGH